MIDECTGGYARDASKHIKCDKKCTESTINLCIATSLTRFDKHYLKMNTSGNVVKSASLTRCTTIDFYLEEHEAACYSIADKNSCACVLKH